MNEITSTLNVPFLDLEPSHAPIRAKLLEEFAALIDANAFTNGAQVRSFELAWADYCGTEHCIGTASGLDALRLGLLGAGIERGDEVIVPANTFAATFEAVTQAGGRPVPVDVRWDDYNLDPERVELALTHRTRFIMPVDLYGQLCDALALRHLASSHGLTIIEDACQAHGATRDGFRAGTIGLAGAFSFYPAKNLGAMGDAGAIVTNDGDLAEKVRALREHGQRAKYHHEFEGFTSRLDTLQAIALLQKLPLLDEWNDQRRTVARSYSVSLSEVGDLVLPREVEGSEPVWHLYVVRTDSPHALAETLASRGIATGRHYPQPPHLSPAYAWLGYKKGEFPVAETAAEHVLSLPIFPGMSEAQVSAVIEAVVGFFARG